MPTVLITSNTEPPVTSRFGSRSHFSEAVSGFEADDLIFANGNAWAATFAKVNDWTYAAGVVPRASGAIEMEEGAAIARNGRHQDRRPTNR